MRRITNNSLGRRDGRGVESNKGETAYGGGALAFYLRGHEHQARDLSRRMSIWLGSAIFFEKPAKSWLLMRLFLLPEQST
jgi:hypothetical protein